MINQRRRIGNIFKYQYLKNTDGYKYIFSPGFIEMTIGQWIYFLEMFSNIKKSLYEEWSPNDSNFYDWAAKMKNNGLAVYWCQDNSGEKYSVAVTEDVENEIVFIKDITSDNLLHWF